MRFCFHQTRFLKIDASFVWGNKSGGGRRGSEGLGWSFCWRFSWFLVYKVTLNVPQDLTQELTFKSGAYHNHVARTLLRQVCKVHEIGIYEFLRTEYP